jgi:hypothetical protein
MVLERWTNPKPQRRTRSPRVRGTIVSRGNGGRRVSDPPPEIPNVTIRTFCVAVSQRREHLMALSQRTLKRHLEWAEARRQGTTCRDSAGEEAQCASSATVLARLLAHAPAQLVNQLFSQVRAFGRGANKWIGK